MLLKKKSKEEFTHIKNVQNEFKSVQAKKLADKKRKQKEEIRKTQREVKTGIKEAVLSGMPEYYHKVEAETNYQLMKTIESELIKKGYEAKIEITMENKGILISGWVPPLQAEQNK